MSLEHVEHADINRFAEYHVNLPAGHAKKYREQIKKLGETLDKYIEDNPDFHLVRMMASGSLAKGTALRSISDADMAVYVRSDDSIEEKNFTEWLAKLLRKVFPTMNDDQIEPKEYCVNINFKGAGIDVDVVPVHLVIPHQRFEWDGNLVSQHDGSPLLTNIPKHLEFIKKRKTKNNPHFAQVVRLVKYWASLRKQDNDDFRFKGFMIEMILSHLCDKDKINISDYPRALKNFFDYLLISNLEEVIIFDDYYQSREVKISSGIIKIYDPVNPENNIGEKYTQKNKDLILEAALEAADAIEYALCATTKEETLRQWRKVFGSAFSI